MKKKVNFTRPTPQVFNEGSAKTDNSQKKLWRQYKAQKCISGKITVAALRDYAAHLVHEGFNSTLCYISAAVSMEAQGGNLETAHFDRLYKNLRRSIAAVLARRMMIAKKAPPLGRMHLSVLSGRQREIAIVLCALGLRKDTVLAIKRKQVFLKVKGTTLVGAQLSVRQDKTNKLRTVHLDCTCNGRKEKDHVFCPVHEPKDLAKVFPITEAELTGTATSCETSTHGFRRTHCLASRIRYEAEKNSAIAEACRIRQGWSSNSPEYFKYSMDVAQYTLGDLLVCHREG